MIWVLRRGFTHGITRHHLGGIVATPTEAPSDRIEDRDGDTATFACTMTVTKVGKDRVYCGSTSFRKDSGQEIGGNDHMYASPAGPRCFVTT